MIPITVVAGPPAPVDFLEAFKHKLSLFGINRPHASTISRLLHFHPQHMFKMAQSSASENDALMQHCNNTDAEWVCRRNSPRII